MNKSLVALSVLILAFASAMFIYLKPSPVGKPVHPLAQIINNEVKGFARVKPGWQYAFPEDYGAHSDYQMDAWYFTGFVKDEQDRSFGFQMTFFRFALAPEITGSEATWASNEIYWAHVAITDVGDRQFYVSERFGRESLGAGATQSPVQVWVDDWELRIPEQTQSQFLLRTVTNEVNLKLDLEGVKQAITNADTGLGNPLLHGYWLPRLRVSGSLEIEASSVNVEGLATLTHVWGGMSLYRGQLALNRFVLQLDDKREILLLQLRRRDGSGDPITTGLIVAPDGTIRQLNRQELSLSVLDYWQSKVDDVRYPGRWQLLIPTEDLQMVIVPMIENQELNLSLRYWAGLVSLSGQSTGGAFSGTGQVELTAYAPDASRQ